MHLNSVNWILKDPLIAYSWVPEGIKTKIKGFNPKANNLSELYQVHGDILYTARMNLPYVFEKYAKDCIIVAFGADCCLFEKDSVLFGSPNCQGLETQFKVPIPPNVKHIFSENIDSISPKLTSLPLGIQRHQIKQISDYVNSGYFTASKNNLLYVNFSINSHRTRPLIANFWKSQPWAKVNFNVNSNLPYEIGCFLNYQWINQSNFVLCPEGNGLDTYRFWETLYLGAVPVVKNFKLYSSSEYVSMPIFRVNDFMQMKLSPNELMSFNYKEVDLSFLTRTYWDNKIKAALNIGNFKS